MRLFHTGLEAGTLDIFPDVVGSPEISSVRARTGERSLYFSGEGIQRVLLPINSTVLGYEMYFRMYMFVENLPTSAQTIVFFPGASYYNLYLLVKLMPDGRILMYEHYLYGYSYYSTKTIELNKWFRLEVGVAMYAVDGVLEVRINGETFVSRTGNTRRRRSGIESRIFGIVIGSPWYIPSDTYETNTLSFYADDIAVNDYVGDKNNSWIGDSFIYLMRPNGVGAYSQLTPVAGDNYSCVSDESESTYVSTSDPNKIDTYSIEEPDYDSPIGTVTSAQISYKIRTAENRSGKLLSAPVIKTGSGEYVGNDKGITMEYLYEREVLEEDPTTNEDWTLTKIKNMEIGVKSK